MAAILADMDDDAPDTPRREIAVKGGKPFPDDIHDVGGDVRWLSYSELAEARGISKASATRLAYRRRWSRRIGNYGTARVAVPVTELAGRPILEEGGIPDDIHDDVNDKSLGIIALQTAIDALREQLARAEEREADFRNQRDRAQQAESQARSELQSERDTTCRLTARIAELEARLAQQEEASAPGSELSDEVLAAISADLDQDAPFEEAAQERLGAGQGAEPPATKKRRQRWWRRLLRHDARVF